MVGIVKLPLDGNPHKAMGLIAHPGEVRAPAALNTALQLAYRPASLSSLLALICRTSSSAVAVSSPRLPRDHRGDGRVDPSAASRRNEVASRRSRRAATASSSFAALIEGGADGAVYQEIVDYSTTPLRAQGEDTTAPREITGRVGVAELGALRAAGHYRRPRNSWTRSSRTRPRIQATADDVATFGDGVVDGVTGFVDDALVHVGALDDAVDENGGGAGSRAVGREMGCAL